MYGTPMVSSVMPNPMGTPMMSTVMPNPMSTPVMSTVMPPPISTPVMSTVTSNDVGISEQTIISLLNSKSSNDNSFGVISTLLDRDVISSDQLSSGDNQQSVQKFDTNLLIQNLRNQMGENPNSYQNYVDSVIQGVSPVSISLPEDPNSIIEKNRTAVLSNVSDVYNTQILKNSVGIETKSKNIDVNVLNTVNKFLELSDVVLSPRYENIQPTNTYSMTNASPVTSDFSNQLASSVTNQFGNTQPSISTSFISNTYSQLPTNKFYTR